MSLICNCLICKRKKWKFLCYGIQAIAVNATALPLIPPCTTSLFNATVFAITTGEWNHSFAALRKNRECVIAIPTVDMLDKVVGIGVCSGTDTDKFAKFKLTPVQSKVVRPPLIKECLANIECKVIDIVKKHNIVVLEAVAAYIDTAHKEKRTVHAVGDGTFIVDGRKIDRRKMMASNIPYGV
ncbi:MAG: flavin reductase family protein [Nitrospinae bacterium]|nr:flavin reductase family protein [Nitrospinota bacterium]